MKVNFFYVFVGVVGLVAVAVPIFGGIGKYQLCKLYFSEMNRAACFFTQLPAVVPRK